MSTNSSLGQSQSYKRAFLCDAATGARIDLGVFKGVDPTQVADAAKKKHKKFFENCETRSLTIELEPATRPVPIKAPLPPLNGDMIGWVRS